jgi:hypothetical protein
MANAVHLDNLRCDGSAHGGCQAGCLLFWKDAWLKRSPGPGRVSRESGSEVKPKAADLLVSSFEALERSTLVPVADGEIGERYRCQATDLLRATSEVQRRERWNPLFYLRDLTSGNVRAWEFFWYGVLAIVNSFTSHWWGWRYPHLCGLAEQRTPTGVLHLQAGERVEVRSKAEIGRTLNAQQRNRGLFFDAEMVPHCGRKGVSVLRRVEKIINEKDGRMIRMPNPCVILDGVTCSGNLSLSRMFCPRSIYPYWREIWLKRLDEREG